MGETLDLSYLANDLFPVRFVPGGAEYPLRNPSALEVIELKKILATKNDEEGATHKALDMIAQLTPSAPRAEIDRMPTAMLYVILGAVVIGVQKVEAAAVEMFPNALAGPKVPISDPAISSGTSSGASPAPPAAMSGMS